MDAMASCHPLGLGRKSNMKPQHERPEDIPRPRGRSCDFEVKHLIGVLVLLWPLDRAQRQSVREAGRGARSKVPGRRLQG